MRASKFILALFFLASLGLNAQSTVENVEQHPNVISTMEAIYVPSIASRSNELTPPITKEAQMMDGRSSKNLVVPGKGSSGEDILAANKGKFEGKLQGKSVDLVFEGASSNSQPSDPSIAVGPDHLFVVFNTGFEIFDKEGVSLVGPFSPNPAIFPTGGCCDLTVSYDNQAERWVIGFLGQGLQVAVSDGPDPVEAGWNVYNAPQVSDYNKLSVWSDGYYVTENTGGSNKLWIMERDAMIAGDASAEVLGFPLPGMVTSGFHSPQVMNISNDNFPEVGGAPIVYLQDDAWFGVSNDHIKLWLADVNWSTPSSSTVSAATQFPTADFTSVFDGGSFSNLVQPNGGATIDALQATIMNQAQFRKFSNHNSMVFNFVVDVDPSGGKLAGIRWYEFRQDNDNMPWSMYQEGTYTSPNGKHAWNASLIMDFQGNIGMGYSAMGGEEDKMVGSYYTGRFAADAPGTMSIEEEIIIEGNNNIPGTRYGDYSKIDVDPLNDKTFYFINELMNSGRKDMVGRFQIASNFANDIGAVAVDPPIDGALTANEQVTVSIFNYGLDTATGFDVNYQINGGAVVTEAFVGSIPSGTSADFSFTTLADLSVEGQTYTINAFTSWATDQFPDNDGVVADVMHLNAIDGGSVSVTSPVSGSGLSGTESVTIEITNFGSATQTTIPVFYTINGGTVVQETYTGSIAQGESDTYTFTTTADLSALGEYDICTGTEIPGDADESNDDVCNVVSNLICQPLTDCDSFGDGLTQLNLADQNINCDCGESGYTDNMDIVFNFVLNENPFEGVLQAGFANTNYKIWIDFNDDFVFQNSEVIAEGLAADADTDVNFTADFSGLANTQGMHVMRVRGIWGGEFEDLDNESCGDIQYGRTNDYTANITGVVGLEEIDFAASDLVINYLDANQYQLNFNTTSYSEDLPVSIINAAGQTLAFYTLTNNGNGYTKTLDMSYVAAGVYFVRVGHANLNKVQRIVVE